MGRVLQAMTVSVLLGLAVVSSAEATTFSSADGPIFGSSNGASPVLFDRPLTVNISGQSGVISKGTVALVNPSTTTHQNVGFLLESPPRRACRCVYGEWRANLVADDHVRRRGRSVGSIGLQPAGHIQADR